MSTNLKVRAGKLKSNINPLTLPQICRKLQQPWYIILSGGMHDSSNIERDSLLGLHTTISPSRPEADRHRSYHYQPVWNAISDKTSAGVI